MPIQTIEELKDEIDRAYGLQIAGNLGLAQPQLMAGGVHHGLLRKYAGTDPVTKYNGVNVDIKKLYFYYFLIDTVGPVSDDGTISHKGFSSALANPWDGDDAPLLNQIANWIGGDTTGQIANSDLDELVWDGPCVVAFAVNLPTWKFFEHPQRSALQFPGGTSGGKTFHDNQTFHDARFDTAAGHRILLANNRHLLPDGSGPRPKVNPKPDDDYKFDLFFQVRLDKGKGKFGELTVTVDPGGKNLGP